MSYPASREAEQENKIREIEGGSELRIKEKREDYNNVFRFVSRSIIGRKFDETVQLEDECMPQKKQMKSKSSRPPEKSYAHRPLLDKLGVKPGSRIALINIRDQSFLAQLEGRAADVSRGWPRKDSDLIFFDAETPADLKELASLRSSLKSDGAIWVVYPKGRQDIREIAVIAEAKRAGLVDNKVVRFSVTHTALRCVIPLAKR